MTSRTLINSKRDFEAKQNNLILKANNLIQLKATDSQLPPSKTELNYGLRLISWHLLRKIAFLVFPRRFLLFYSLSVVGFIGTFYCSLYFSQKINAASSQNSRDNILRNFYCIKEMKKAAE